MISLIGNTNSELLLSTKVFLMFRLLKQCRCGLRLLLSLQYGDGLYGLFKSCLKSTSGVISSV